MLADFLKKNRAEATDVCLYEYNEEEYLKEEREIAMEKGITIGEQLARIRLICKKIQKNCSVAEIADMLEEDETVIQNIYNAANAFSPDYDAEKILKLLESQDSVSK